MKAFKIKSLVVLTLTLISWIPESYSQSNDIGPIFEKVADTVKLKDFISETIQKAENALELAKSEKTEYTYENTVIPFRQAQYYYSLAQGIPAILKDLHSDALFRNVATKEFQKVSGKNKMGNDHRLYEVLLQVDQSNLTSAQRYPLDRTLKSFIRAGIHLEQENQEQLIALNRKISSFGMQMMSNLNTTNQTISLPADSLQGLPDDILKNLPISEKNTVTFPMIPPYAYPFVLYADNENVRKKVFREMINMGYPENYSLLDSIRNLRSEVAQLLGYNNYASFDLEPMMVNSTEKLEQLLDEVAQITSKGVKEEQQRLLQLKKQQDSKANQLYIWDVLYYQEKLKMKDYQFDSRVMREYFPYNQVEKGVFEIYTQMFELEFIPIKTTLWSDEAKGFEVRKNKQLLGRIYLDMHPREGKSTGNRQTFFAFGGQNLPELILICNFPKTTENNPGLMEIFDVLTYFHEFGHLMHSIFNGQQEFPGSFENDFVEAPSQLFEDWAINPKILKRYAKHYQTEESIPDTLLVQYVNASTFGRATEMGQMASGAYASLNLYRYTPDEKSIDTIINEGSLKFNNSEIPDDFHPAASWHHLYHMGARYYTYLFSGILAKDLLSGFNAEDLTDPEKGKLYQEKILSSTGTKPSAELIEDFLGRPYNYDAWREWILEK